MNRQRSESEEVPGITGSASALLLDRLPLGYQSLDRDGCLVFVNQAWLDILGYTREEVLGTPFMKFLPLERVPQFRECFSLIYNLGEIRDVEFKMLRKDGSVVDVVFDGKLELDKEGNFFLTHCVMKDVGEKKRVKEALKQSEEFNKAVVEHSPIGVSVRSPVGTLLLANDAWKQIWGYTDEKLKEDMEFERTELRFDENDSYLGKWAPQVKAIYQQGGQLLVPEMKVPHPRKAGALWVSQYFYSIMDDEGKVERVVVLTDDITERKKAQDSLARSEAQQRALFQGSTDPVVIVDLEDRVMAANPVFEELFGYSNEELKGKTFPGHEGFDDGVFPVWVETCRSGEGISGHETHRRAKDGTLVPVSLSISPIMNSLGELEALSVWFRNITEQRKAQDSLKASESRYRGLFDNSSASLLEEDFSAVKTKLDELVSSGISDLGRYFREHPGEIANCASLVSILDVNQTTLDFFRADTKEEITGNLAKFFLDESLDAFKEELITLYETGGPFRGDIVGRTLDGIIRDFAITVTVAPGSEESWERVMVSLLDVSERKKAQLTLQKERDRAQQYLDVAGVMMIALDREGKVTLINQKGCELLGLEEEEILGRNWFESFLPERNRDQVTAVFGQMMSGEIGPVEYFENPILTSTGEERLLAWHNTLLTNDAGDIQGSLSSGMDITEQRGAEMQVKKSEEEYRLLAENSQDIILVHDLGGRIQYVNRFGMVFTGLGKKELLGRCIDDFISEDGAADRKVTVEQIRAGNFQKRVSELRFVGPDREDHFLEVVTTPIVEDGKAQAVLVVARDISDRKRAQEALVSSEEKYSSVVENSNDGIIIHRDAKILFANFAGCQMVGTGPEDILGRNIMEFIAPQDRKMVLERYQARVAGKDVPATYEITLMRPDATHIPVEINAVIASYEGEPAAHVFFRDITQRKKADEELRESQSRLKTFMKNFPGLIYMYDQQPDGTRVARYVDTGKEEVVGKQLAGEMTQAFDSFFDHILPEDSKKLQEEAAKVEQEGGFLDVAYRMDIEGTIKWFRSIGRPMKLESGSVRWHGILIDITAQKVAEDKVRELKEFNEGIVQGINEGIIVEDAEGYLSFVNPSFAAMLGFEPEELVGKHWASFVPEDQQVLVDFANLRRRKGEGDSYEMELLRKDETRLPVLVSGTPNFRAGKFQGLLAAFTDITAQKKVEKDRLLMEDQLRHNQRLGAIGTLASGVAHEINNPIMGIINYADLIRDGAQGEELVEYTTGIMDEGQRIAEIVKNLLAFAREDSQRHSPANMADILDSSLSLLRSHLKKNQITLELDVPANLPQLKCRSHQIRQVLVNLLGNARDALNTRYGYYHEDKKLRVGIHIFEKEGKRWLRTTVADHGTGISPEDMAKVFDPFFTTKPRDVSTGKYGTGLGLSVSYGIIRDHHGELWVESKLGEYCRFHMDLPIDNGWELEGKEGPQEDE